MLEALVTKLIPRQSSRISGIITRSQLLLPQVLHVHLPIMSTSSSSSMPTSAGKPTVGMLLSPQLLFDTESSSTLRYDSMIETIRREADVKVIVQGKIWSEDETKQLASVDILFADTFLLPSCDRITELFPRLRWIFCQWDGNDWTEEETKQLASVDVLYARTFLLPSCYRVAEVFPRLRWIFATSAGVDLLTRNLDTSKPPPPFILTRHGGYYAPLMAQYVLGSILAHERHFREVWTNQQNRKWSRRLVKNLTKLSLGIIGVGDIGKEIAKAAKSFGMEVWGTVRNMPTDDQKSPHVDVYRTLPNMSEMLAACDYICAILPSVPSTDGLFDGDILSHCKAKKSVFINVGRGNVVKEETLLRALSQGWIGHVILDVYEKEPLPESSELWTHPNVTLSPHVSCNCLDEQAFAQDFIESYKRFVNGEPLKYVVDWDKGY